MVGRCLSEDFLSLPSRRASAQGQKPAPELHGGVEDETRQSLRPVRMRILLHLPAQRLKQNGKESLDCLRKVDTFFTPGRYK